MEEGTLLQDNNIEITAINKYINECFKNSGDYITAISNLRELICFFKAYNYIPKGEVILYLVENNKLLSETLKYIVNKYISEIVSGSIEKIFDDKNTIMLIEAYCLSNNIEMYEYSNDDLELSTFDDNVKIYFKEISKMKLLSKEEEIYLFQRMSNGDKSAKNIIINSNLKLVVFVAKKKMVKGLQFLDLIQEGNIGLMKAVEKFDVTKGYKFSTYAVWWIKQSIEKAIIDKSRNIRIPANVLNIIKKINMVKLDLEYRLNREPTKEEIANKMEMSIEKINEIYRLTQMPLSLETPINEEETTYLGDSIVDNISNTPEEYCDNEILKKHIEDSFSILTEKEKQILKLRFGFDNESPKTLEEIGNIFGITRQRVSMVVKKSLSKIRNSSYGSILNEHCNYQKINKKKKIKTI